MRLFSSLVLTLSLTLSFVSLSFAHAHLARRHPAHHLVDLARRDPGEVNLHKRFDNARFTFYAVGLGACGTTNQPSDFIVALNSAQYDSGSYCGQTITITANGKTTQATIMDRCPGCPYSGLDFSQGLFQYFADISAGVIYGSWDFGSGGPPPSPSPSPSPTPTSSDNPPTTSPPSSTTSQPPSTTSSVLSTTTFSSSASTTATSHTTSSVSTSSVPVAVAGGVVPGALNGSFLLDVNSVAVSAGQFLVSCYTS